MKDLDLSNPPAGATHFNPHDSANPFRKVVGKVSYGYMWGGWQVMGGCKLRRFWMPLPMSTPTAHSIDFSQMPEGTTHICNGTHSLWRKAANGRGFAWDGENWLLRDMKGETWTQVMRSGAVEYSLGNELFDAADLLRVQGPTIADLIEGLRCAELQGRIEPGDYVAYTWPRSVYKGLGLHFTPCTPKTVEPAQWDGKGLPPVGVDCEVLWSSVTGVYVTCHVLAHDEHRAVFRFTSGERKGEYQADGQYLFNLEKLPHFRPIKTAEQLAAEQREAALIRMFQIEPALTTCMASRLYAAGLRFPGEK